MKMMHMMMKSATPVRPEIKYIGYFRSNSGNWRSEVVSQVIKKMYIAISYLWDNKRENFILDRYKRTYLLVFGRANNPQLVFGPKQKQFLE